MSGIDYSKWDKFAREVEDDEESDEYEEISEEEDVGPSANSAQFKPSNKPTVTKLDAPTTVTFGGGQSPAFTNASTTKKEKVLAATGDDRKDLAAGTKASSIASGAKKEAEQKRSSSLSTLSHNGGVTESYHWSQSKQDVIIYWKVSPSTKAKDVNIQLLQPQLSAAVNSTESCFRLSLLIRSQKVVNDKPLCHPIILDDDGIIDWELISAGPDQRFVRIMLQKKHPGPNIVVWWKCAFRGDPEIDVKAIEDRRGFQAGAEQQTTSQSASGERTTSEGASAPGAKPNMQEVWNSAHKAFKERVNQRKKISVDVDEDEGSDVEM